MNRIASIIKMHYRDKWTWFIIPWSIMMFSFVVNLIVGVFLRSEEVHYTGGISSIFIYLFIAGMFTLSQTFPFAISLSARRKDYFLGTAAMVAMVSAVTAAALLLLGIVETQLTGGWGVRVQFFHLPYVNDGNMLQQLWIYFSVLLHLFFFGFVMASVHRRFRMTGLILLLAIMLVVPAVAVTVLTYYRWWGDLFGWLSGYTAFQHTLWMLPLTIVYALLSYLFLRKSTV
ncbi:hypothetical protein M3650_25905 [Paenibacillus sp. MER TA 81-3]|uniref:hypothetical protein n=1 Tax=Paenibacillus sp. MER TA 81-3 TaxID=2939573 RepID=UPI002041CA43|nr:hypothetical protein [Paenibacillus sp. MER TA 81-3]MCM3341966.1 hypothetical protein [Paenibacillus sp. MER TA 81-3]